MAMINGDGLSEGVNRRLLSIVCPFCDSMIKRWGPAEAVIRCRNCGEAFEPDSLDEFPERERPDFF